SPFIILPSGGVIFTWLAPASKVDICFSSLRILFISMLFSKISTNCHERYDQYLLRCSPFLLANHRRVASLRWNSYPRVTAQFQKYHPDRYQWQYDSYFLPTDRYDPNDRSGGLI